MCKIYRKLYMYSVFFFHPQGVPALAFSTPLSWTQVWLFVLNDGGVNIERADAYAKKRNCKDWHDFVDGPADRE